MHKETVKAINCYIEANRLQHMVEQADKNLDEAVRDVPEEEMPNYLDATDKVMAVTDMTCPICTPRADVQASS